MFRKYLFVHIKKLALLGVDQKVLPFAIDLCCKTLVCAL